MSGTRTARAMLLIVAAIAAACGAMASQERAVVIPLPAVDEPAGDRSSEIAVFAGGCFWGVQGVYQHVNGVANAVSGYAGGEKETAQYDRVGTGRTGHAESVQITFDPRVATYGKLLQIFFAVVHDPTQLNRQGPDTGTEYRSAIFPSTAEQAGVAKAFITQLDAAHVFGAPIVTTIELGRTFYRAEEYHQDFLELNPSNPYIAFNDIPKVQNLKRMFPDLYRAVPVLVNRPR